MDQVIGHIRLQGLTDRVLAEHLVLSPVRMHVEIYGRTDLAYLLFVLTGIHFDFGTVIEGLQPMGIRPIDSRSDLVSEEIEPEFSFWLSHRFPEYLFVIAQDIVFRLDLPSQNFFQILMS